MRATVGSGTVVWSILSDILHTYMANGSLEVASPEEARDINDLCFREEWFSAFPGNSAAEKALYPNSLLARRALVGALSSIARQEFDQNGDRHLKHMSRVLAVLRLLETGTYGSVRYHILRCLASVHPLEWACKEPLVNRSMNDTLTALRAHVTVHPDTHYWELHPSVVRAATHYCAHAAENGPDDYIVRNQVMFIFHVAFLRSCAHGLCQYRDVSTEKFVTETQRHIQVFIQYLYNLMGR